VPSRKKAKKAKGKARSRKRAKSARVKPKKRKRLTAVAVGDVVRLPAEARNQIARYDPNLAQGTRGAEAIEGIVCAIRRIATGKLVPKTRGALEGHVLEILHSQTFRVYLSSDRNTGGPRGPERLTDNPIWLQLREQLKAMADKKELVSAAPAGLWEQQFSALLDGWRIVKVKAEEVEPVR